MLKHKIASVPVLGKKDRVVGMLSQWDCLRQILAGSYSEEIGGVVKDLMDPTVHTVTPNDDIVDVAAAMTSSTTSMLPPALMASRAGFRPRFRTAYSKGSPRMKLS